MTQVLGKTLSLEDTIETILGELQRVVPYDSCSVQVIQGNRLVIVGGRGFDDLDALLGQGFDLDDENNLNSHVVRSKRTQVFADVSENPNFASDLHGSARIRGWICAPMIVGDRVVGVISVDKFEPDFYDEELGGACDGIRGPGGGRDRERSLARDGARRPRTGRNAPCGSAFAQQRAGCAAGVRPDPVGAAQGGALPGASVQQFDGERAGDRRRLRLSEPREMLGHSLRLARSRRSRPRADRAARDPASSPTSRERYAALPRSLRRGAHQELDGRAPARRRPPDRDADARQLRARLLHRRTREDGRGVCRVRRDGDRQGALPQRAPARTRARGDALDRDAGARQDPEPRAHDRDDPRTSCSGSCRTTAAPCR